MGIAICALYLIGIVSCQNIGKSKTEQIVEEMTSIYEEGTQRAENATTIEELGNLTYEIRAKAKQIDVSGYDPSSLSEEERTEAQRVMNRYYNTVNERAYQLRGKPFNWE